MTNIDALVFEFIRRHKAVIQAFNEGKLERYIDSLCRSYYGCACSGFNLMTAPKGIEIGTSFDDTHKLSKQELCENITEWLRQR